MEVDAQESVKSYNRILHRQFGVWRLAFGVWRSAFGVWRSAFGVRRSAFGVQWAQEICEISTSGDAHSHPLQSDEERASLRLAY